MHANMLLLVVGALFHACVAQNGPWINIAPLPDALGEVSAAIINNIIYVVGSGTDKTYAYNITANTWRSDLPPRPVPGSHHAAVVPDDGNLWLIGGNNGGEGTIQVFDVKNKAWGTPFGMPLELIAPAGSMVAVHVKGNIYMCGGNTWDAPVQNNCVIFNIATVSYSAMAPLPAGINHAAYATDGVNIYVAGGRNTVALPLPGLNHLQIYNIASGKWTWSGAAGSTLSPLPQARGGLGSGVFFQGAFHVIGGESDSLVNPVNGVFQRYDIYNVASNQWTRGTDLPEGRHGIYPVSDGKFIYVIGGGNHNGVSAITSAMKIALGTSSTTSAPKTTSRTTTAGKTTTAKAATTTSTKKATTTTTKKATTTTTKKATTTTKKLSYCPTSGVANSMRCGDGSLCDVNAQGWNCCNTKGGRKACPVSRPIMCSYKTCSGQYCCDYSNVANPCNGQILAKCP